VFVSSTLGELADERRAVSRAIEALRLTPVMFELGARPYSPREVYQQYLAQSDVFIGLYWQRYGQPAPGMQVSGLEDDIRARPPLFSAGLAAPPEHDVGVQQQAHDLTPKSAALDPARQRDHLGDRVAGPADDDLLAVLHPLDDLRQVGLGVMDVELLGNIT
jgi:hypothetical protein